MGGASTEGCRVSTSVQWHDLKAVLQVLPHGVQVQLSVVLAPLQLVPPGAMSGGVGGRRRAGRGRCRQGRFGDVDLRGAAGGGRRRGSWWDDGGTLDGRSVPPQDSPARGLLLVLLRLLLTLDLLLQDQLNVLLQTAALNSRVKQGGPSVWPVEQTNKGGEKKESLIVQR